MVDPIGLHKLVPVSRSKRVTSRHKKTPSKEQDKAPHTSPGADKAKSPRGANIDEYC